MPVITSANEVVFWAMFVRLSVCLLATSRKTIDRSFMKILSETYLWTRKSQYILDHLRIRTPDLDRIRVGLRSALFKWSRCSCELYHHDQYLLNVKRPANPNPIRNPKLRLLKSYSNNNCYLSLLLHMQRLKYSAAVALYKQRCHISDVCSHGNSNDCRYRVRRLFVYFVLQLQKQLYLCIWTNKTNEWMNI